MTRVKSNTVVWRPNRIY